MKILLTNDDGIQAKGLHVLRRALAALEGVEVAVIAPDSNRSASARSITTRQPLSVEEVDFGDGSSGFATDGTPVDCVRFAALGLLDFQPELVISGINHGANLGDDVTYSGTVAAALEGTMQGLPAIAVSQQSSRGEMDFRLGQEFDFTAAAEFTATLVRNRGVIGLPSDTLININCPACADGVVNGVEVTQLGRRIYRDTLDLEQDQGGGRKLYRIYGDDPSYHQEEGTDFAVVAQRKISVTPMHFDLTDHKGVELLKRWKLEALIGGANG